MPLLDTRDDLKVRQAEVFYFSDKMEGVRLEELCNLALTTLQKRGTPMEMARFLKSALENKFPGQWSVIIGKTFGAFLSVDARNFVHFRIGRTYFVLHKKS